MARERMAKLLKYDHFETHIDHIITYFMSSLILHHQHVSREVKTFHLKLYMRNDVGIIKFTD